MTVALITHPACLGHDPGPWHPECPDRLRAVLAALEDACFRPLLRREAPAAEEAALLRAHSAAHVRAILAIRPPPGRTVQLDPDTAMCGGSADAALRAAGGAVLAVDAVMEGWASAAFAAIRPPGHHAEPARAMGFCLFNNAAVAACHARARWSVERVAVVDFDVHHGNGTQAMFAADPALFYASSHQSPCYPGTGWREERGCAGNIVNVLLRPGSDSAAFRAGWEGGDPANARRLRAGAAHRLGRVRRAQGGPAGAASAGNRGFRLGHAQAGRMRPAAHGRTCRLAAGRGLRPRRPGGLGGGACPRADAKLTPSARERVLGRAHVSKRGGIFIPSRTGTSHISRTCRSGWKPARR